MESLIDSLDYGSTEVTMKKISLISISILVSVFAVKESASFSTAANGPGRTVTAVTETDLRAASEKAIKLIQHSQAIWYQRETCTSCHHQLLPEIPLQLARERGVPVDEKVARQTTTSAFAFLNDLDSTVQGYDYIDMAFDGWALTAANRAGIRRSLTTDAEAQFIASHQRSDGSWCTTDDRPPQSSSRFTTTAVCANAVALYLPVQLKTEKDTRMRLARAWLLKSQPHTTEDRTFQLFGLYWTGAGEAVRQAVARKLLSEQREDGGWSELPELTSDPYSTGEVLAALHEGAQVPTNDPAYQRGLQFLLKAQRPDGSWQIKSRLHPPAPVSPPYVNIEFPPGQHDQFVSIMATSWATTALLHAIEPHSFDRMSQYIVAAFEPAEKDQWIYAALDANAAEMKKLLDAGMSANSKTAQGTTALMLAARDLQKVKLLIDSGADINARAKSGFTPLMVASRYHGNAAVVRFLLQKGARPNSEKGIEVRNETTALFLAVMAGDVETARALVDAGLRIEDRMKILGTFSSSMLNYATFLEGPAMVEFLLSKGADPNEVDDDKISVLAWAAIANRPGAAQAFLARGAKPNPVDRFGMTPLLYAASINHGDTLMIEKLIAAGANLNAKTKEGLTAFDLAKNYNHEAMAKLLASKTTASR